MSRRCVGSHRWVRFRWRSHLSEKQQESVEQIARDLRLLSKEEQPKDNWIYPSSKKTKKKSSPLSPATLQHSECDRRKLFNYKYLREIHTVAVRFATL
jgi:hypothetical protein